jgi:glycosyltransferase involved in cell wall biosynthesis
MSHHPLVSLLIPTHNNGQTVANTISSCVNQTFKDLEIVVYDEASKDNTRQIISEFAAQDSRIRVLTNEINSGAVLAWRKLLHEARGQWSGLVFSDDILMPTFVEKLVEPLQRNPNCLIATCGTLKQYLPEEGKSPGTRTAPRSSAPRRRPLHSFSSAVVKGDEYSLGIFASIFPVTPTCSLFDVKVAREVFDHYIHIENPYGFDYSRQAYGNDAAFLCEMGLRSGDLVVVGEPLVVLCSTTQSLTVVLQRENIWEYWLRYLFALRAAWIHCRHLSPRMEALIRVVEDRVHFCDTFYWVTRKRWPRDRHLLRLFRALWFIIRYDRHINRHASSATMRRWVERHCKNAVTSPPTQA